MNLSGKKEHFNLKSKDVVNIVKRHLTPRVLMKLKILIQ